ncbi:MAG TPA: VCBS repeat-containing protein, partial [Thermoanaerobaculia bacterium]|nr:VCBS repeat-containing protein [Thermoanaerobaculia bacterium]
GAVAGNAASVTVQAVDVADAPMAFTGTIHFTSNDPNATLPADYTFADADHGGHAFAATFRRAGTASITATDIASPLTGTAQLQIAPAATSALTINVPSPVRSGTATTIVVTAHDAFGNVTPEYRGTVQFARSDANDTYPPSYAFTAADAGTKTFLATLRRAGTRSVGVFDVAVVSRNAFAKVIVTSPLVVGDINNDGKSDLFWRDSSTGANSMWLMDGASTLVAVSLPTFTNLDYRIDAVADFDGDAQPDLLWRNYTNGATALWLLNGASIKAVVNLPGLQNLDYHIAGAADFDGNGDPDLIWRNRATGATALWIMNGTSFSSIVNLPGLQNLDYHIAGAADFNGDGSVDIVWRNAVTGANALWLMNRTSFSSIVNLPNLPDAQAGIGAVGDYDGDGMADLVWRNPSTGANTIWKMNGTAFVSAIDLQALTNPSVELVGAK